MLGLNPEDEQLEGGHKGFAFMNEANLFIKHAGVTSGAPLLSFGHGRTQHSSPLEDAGTKCHLLAESSSYEMLDLRLASLHSCEK